MTRLASQTACVFTVVMLALAAFGQSKGQPVIYSGSGNYAVDPAGTVIDVAVYDSTDTDFCERVEKAWSSVLTTARTGITVDARGLIGSQQCSLSTYQTPFPSGATGRLLLGNATITINYTWAVPNGVEVVGLGAYNTTIQAPSSGSVSPLITFGTSTPNFASGTFGIKIRSLAVDCHDTSNCTAISNQKGEEGSIVEDVIINNATYGLSLTTGGMKADNSGPYRNVTIQYPNCSTYCAGAIGVQVSGSDGGQVIRGLENITVSVCGSHASAVTGFHIIGSATRISNSTVSCATTGIQIGCTTSSCSPPTHNVEVEDVFIGSATTPIVASPNSSNIYLSNITSNETSTSTLVSDMGVAKGGALTTVTLPGPNLGFYIRGKD